MADEFGHDIRSTPSEPQDSTDELEEPNNGDFEEIRHCGGKLKFSARGSIQFSHSSPLPASIHIICFSLNGFFQGLVQPWGYGGPIPEIPVGSTFVYLLSDSHGLFGRFCPKCKKYFRTSALSDNMYCTYCSFVGNSGAFFTEKQKAFTKKFLETINDVLISEKDTEIDIDEIIRQLPENTKSPFAYSEEKQQSVYHCSGCKVRYDILGDYGRCPYCGYLNALEVFQKYLSAVNERIQNPRFTINKREQRQEEWIYVLGRCFSIFEGFGNELRRYLLYIPATPRRKRRLQNQSFQRIIEANKILIEIADIDYFSGMSEEEINFLNRSVYKRHIFTHNNGVVDQEYLDKTSDLSVRLGEKIRLRRKEVSRLSGLLELAANNYFSGLESILRRPKENRSTPRS